MHKLFHLLLVPVAGSLFCVSGTGLAAEKPAVQPNIVLIMADDMGYSDIGCYGSEIQTPNLDRLVREGLRFTQFYNNAKCIPTQVSFLTGAAPKRDQLFNVTAGIAEAKDVISANPERAARMAMTTSTSIRIDPRPWFIGCHSIE
jgi:hypothetical protein